MCLERGLFNSVNSSLLLVGMRAQPAASCELAGALRGTGKTLELPQLLKILHGTAAELVYQLKVLLRAHPFWFYL